MNCPKLKTLKTTSLIAKIEYKNKNINTKRNELFMRLRQLVKQHKIISLALRIKLGNYSAPIS